MNFNWGVRDKTGSHGVPWRTKWKPGAFQFAVLGGLVRFTKSRTPSGQTKPVIFGKFLKKKSWEDHPDSKTSGFSGFKNLLPLYLFDETKARVSALFWGQKRQPELLLLCQASCSPKGRPLSFGMGLYQYTHMFSPQMSAMV